jgi:predicted enzyme related to lactoylglutathione lyase
MTAASVADRPTTSRNVGDPNFFILYVKDAGASAAFYSELLGREPAQASPTFACFALESGVMFALWSIHDVQPPVDGSGSTSEISLPVANAVALQATHDEWKGRGLPIVQQPTKMSFGPTFVALDPDGHRLRVFAPAA